MEKEKKIEEKIEKKNLKKKLKKKKQWTIFNNYFLYTLFSLPITCFVCSYHTIERVCNTQHSWSSLKQYSCATE